MFAIKHKTNEQSSIKHKELTKIKHTHPKSVYVGYQTQNKRRKKKHNVFIIYNTEKETTKQTKTHTHTCLISNTKT